MIKFINNSSDLPYKKLRDYYRHATSKNQSFVEAINISSYSTETKEVDSRFVNLKIVDNKDLIFFTNYESKKAIQFFNHDQVAITILWGSINLQIRMKAKIRKTSQEFNQSYFTSRSIDKNALAISSKQSQEIASFDLVKSKFQKVRSNNNLHICPEYWGGYAIQPYEFEFWKGNEFRLNKRNLYVKDKNDWIGCILEP